MIKFLSLSLVAMIGTTTDAFTTTTTLPTTTTTTTSRITRHGIQGSAALYASSMGGQEEGPGLFKAGLLANCEEEAADLANKKIRSVKDLGWTKPAKRAGNMRPRHWAWGGSGEKSVQDKPGYDESSPQCVEKWLSLEDFYAIVKDDTAVADTIFVALAGGGAFIERDVAESVIAKWRPSSGTKGRGFAAIDTAAFKKTVSDGRTKFLAGWGAFSFITGFAVLGIIFPNNPVQLALVDSLELILGPDVVATK